MMKLVFKTGFLIAGIAFFGIFSSCTNNTKNENLNKELNFSVDEKFTDYFARDCCGVTGSDGYYSVLLPDGRTVWLFGDSFLGTVNDDGSREKRSPIFVRNSFAVQDGDSLRTLYNIVNGKDASLIIHADALNEPEFTEDSVWYWPGDGFVENGKLKVFLSKFHQESAGNWGFKWDGTNIATFNLPEIKLESIDTVFYPHPAEIHWGHAICDDDKDYTYIYGAGQAQPYVARAPKGNILGQWEFFNGIEWIKDSKLAKPMLDDKVSEQFSVFKLKNKFVLLTQESGFSKNICVYTSDLPYKEWSEKKIVAEAEKPIADTNLFTYNALAHPQFIKNEELLVSYCVNSFNIEDLFLDAQKYRPVFIRIPINAILED